MNNLRNIARYLGWLIVALVLAALLALIPPTRLAAVGKIKEAAAPEGQVHFFRVAGPSFERYVDHPNASTKQWLRNHLWRMLSYSPYFDSRLVWYPNAWVYKDLYALYTDEPLAQQHPEWILRDAHGNPLYIPWGCENGACPQYAADVGNPAFRAYWLAQAGDTLSRGYRGMFVDDVNLEWRVGDNQGNFVQPIDPRTGKAMTRADWQRYFAEFAEQIWNAFPDKEIVHNALWFADAPTNPYVQREIDSADWINLERGINDGGITGGGGSFGIESFFSYVDSVHSRGKSVVFDEDVSNRREREYGVVGWLLINTGWDVYGNSAKWSTPADWWKGYSLNLGAATSSRYIWKQLYRRNFQRGLVLLNPPNAPTRTIHFAHAYRTLEGNLVSSISLKAHAGIVLLNQ
ncbi:MAG TPA: putative glycoside hydrolase [Anaerolineae bacterium]|nr:putative glycoside hydrolase [Anaerolineae bacterium]